MLFFISPITTSIEEVMANQSLGLLREELFMTVALLMGYNFSSMQGSSYFLIFWNPCLFYHMASLACHIFMRDFLRILTLDRLHVLGTMKTCLTLKSHNFDSLLGSTCFLNLWLNFSLVFQVFVACTHCCPNLSTLVSWSLGMPCFHSPNFLQSLSHYF